MVKNLPANAGDSGWAPGLGKSPGEGNGNPPLSLFLFMAMYAAAWVFSSCIK